MPLYNTEVDPATYWPLRGSLECVTQNQSLFCAEMCVQSNIKWIHTQDIFEKSFYIKIPHRVSWKGSGLSGSLNRTSSTVMSRFDSSYSCDRLKARVRVCFTYSWARSSSYTAPPPRRAFCPTACTESQTRSGWCCGTSQSRSSSLAPLSHQSTAWRMSPGYRQTWGPGLWG